MKPFPKNEIIYKLIPYESKYFKPLERPHRRYLNMVIAYEIALENPDAHFYLFEPVTNKEMRKWSVGEQALFEAASKNTRHLLGYTCVNTIEQMEKLFAEVKEAFDEEEMEELEKILGFSQELLDHYINHSEAPPIYILSNNENRNGASCILYPNVLSDLADKFADDFYLVPSNDEMIAVPAGRVKTFEDIRRLIEMIVEMNVGLEGQEELLSETLFYYSRENGVLDTIGGITRKKTGKTRKSTPRGVSGAEIIMHEKGSRHIAPSRTGMS